jgi:hypothetical protein
MTISAIFDLTARRQASLQNERTPVGPASS